MKHWSEFEGEVRERRLSTGTSCSVGSLLRSLHTEAREAVEAVLAKEELPATAIHKALRERVGERAPSPWTIGNHRRGGCNCGSQE